MTLEQYKELCKKFPIIEKIVNYILAPIAGIIALLGAIIIMFIFSQMFDDKHTYDSGSNIVDFVNWFTDGAKDTAKHMLDEKETQNETEADHTSVVESNPTGIVDRVGNDQTSVHK